MKLKTKIIVIPSILASIMFIILLIFKVNITSNITDLINKNTPKLIAILEIEINLDEMHISLYNALGSYDNDIKKHYIDKYNDSVSDQENYLKEFKKLSVGNAEEKVFMELNKIRHDYLNTGNEILSLDKELKKIIQQRRDILNNNIEFYLDSKLQNSLNKNDEQYIEKQEILLEIEINIHELISAVRGYIIKSDEFLLDRVKDSENDIIFWKSKLNKLTWNEENTKTVKDLNKQLEEARKLSDKIIDHKIRQDILLERFHILNIKLDDLIDNVINKDVIKNQNFLSEQLIDRFNVSVILLIIFSLFVLISMYKVSNTLMNNIYKIINAIKKYGISNNPTKISIETEDEVRLLGDTINDMSSLLYKSALEKNNFIDKLNKLNHELEEKINESNKKEELLSQYILFSRTDTKGIITDVSEFFCNLSGYTKEELIGKPHSVIRHPDMKDSLYKDLWTTIKSGKEWRGEIKNKAKDGHYYWVNSRISSEYDENGNKKGYISIREDITAKKDVEKQQLLLINQSKMAAMGEMIGNIAHQWRQPLSVISTGATGMKVQKEFGLLDDDMINNTCDAINSNAQYLSKTIDDFRNFIKGNRNKSIYNLTSSINSFLHLLEGTIKNNDILVNLDLDDEIQINGYENELKQCLINIFNNAKDVLKEKELNSKYVFISTALEDDNAVIRIKDNGGGIPENILSKVFEPYFTTKHQSQGTGLGLHMTYNLIVDGMKGKVEVNNVSFEYENKKYVGAEFKIILPTKI